MLSYKTMFVGVCAKGRIYYDTGGKRYFSDSATPGGSPNSEGSPEENFVMFFENVESDKRNILNKLKNKSGVYLIKNKITNDLYVGSSITLSRRMAAHFFHARSNKETNIILYRSMRKYGLANFSLAILEFCDSDLIVCSDLEQKFFLLWPAVI